MDKKEVEKKKELIERAKELRRNMTKQEKHLWYDFLQRYPVKIYKQRVIDTFIADFYCHKARLVIELDGSQHYTLENKSYDTSRTAILEKYGLKVLRFDNRDVDDEFDGVCRVIDREIKARMNEDM